MLTTFKPFFKIQKLQVFSVNSLLHVMFSHHEAFDNSFSLTNFLKFSPLLDKGYITRVDNKQVFVLVFRNCQTLVSTIHGFFLWSLIGSKSRRKFHIVSFNIHIISLYYHDFFIEEQSQYILSDWSFFHIIVLRIYGYSVSKDVLW